MTLYFTSRFLKKVKQKTRRDKSLKQEVRKQLRTLQQNPNHPSLRLHKLTGKRINQFAIWVEGNVRTTLIKQERDLILTDIITHNEY